jgi:type VI secretion system protein VasD
MRIGIARTVALTYVASSRYCLRRPTSMLRLAVRAAAFVAALPAITSCGGAQPPPPQSACNLPISIGVNASDRLNPNELAEPLPTVVRVFQLKRSARVEEADFVQLWEQPDETVGEDLIQKQELTVYPGSRQRIAMELVPETRFLVGMAVFRQPTATQWRTVVPLPPATKLCAAYKERAPDPAVEFSLDGYRIEARSHLLRATDRVDLPSDVTTGSERKSDPPASSPPAQQAAPPASSYDAVEAPAKPRAPKAHSAPRAPSAPSPPRAPATSDGI